VFCFDTLDEEVERLTAVELKNVKKKTYFAIGEKKSDAFDANLEETSFSRS